MSEPKKDPFKIEDPSILTYIEHKLIGSSIDREDMIANPFTPMAVLDGRRPIDVAAERLKVGEIKSMDPEAFNLIGGKTPIVKLGEMSLKSGKVINIQFELTGIYDEYGDSLLPNRNPDDLAKYPLTEKGRKKYGVDVFVGRGEYRG